MAAFDCAMTPIRDPCVLTNAFDEKSKTKSKLISQPRQPLFYFNTKGFFFFKKQVAIINN